VTATAEGFRNLFRQTPQAVWVLTTRDSDGVPFGVTVTSLTPVSSDPPTVTFALHSTSSVLPVFAESPRILAQVVSVDGEDTARHFAAPGIDRFSTVEDSHGPGGLPAVEDCCGRMLIRVDRVLPVADSALFIGTVQVTWIPLDPREPAVYRNRTYTRTDAGSQGDPVLQNFRMGHDDD